MKPANKKRKLEARREDYDRMTGRAGFNAPHGAFTKPGSNKK